MSDRTPQRPFRLDPGDVIPDYWTAKEARLVYDFLLLVLIAISDRYEDEMLAPVRESDAPPSDNVPHDDHDTSLSDDDIPF